MALFNFVPRNLQVTALSLITIKTHKKSVNIIPDIHCILHHAHVSPFKLLAGSLARACYTQ